MISRAWPAVAVLLAFTFSFVPHVRADVAAEQEARFKRLSGGVETSPVRALEGMALALGKTNPIGIAEQVPILDFTEFDKALRLLTRRAPGHPSDFQTGARTANAITKGDILLATFWARAAGASESAQGAFVLESAENPQLRFVEYQFECEREWRRFFIPFLAAHDAPPGEAIIRFRAGYGPQVLELGGLRLVNYSKVVPLGELPYTPLAYKGRRADAPWRAEANASIEKERKAQFTIVVRNSKGKVIPWTEVRVRQLQHTYEFGTAVRPDALLAETNDGDRYRWAVLDSFNRGEINTGLDFGSSAESRETAVDAARWLEEYDLQSSSHSLFGGDGQLPSDLAALREQRSQLRSAVLSHVREKVAVAKGVIAEWSIPIALAAENELGIPLVADVLRTARETDPDAKLIVHAGNVLVEGVDQAQQTAIIRAIRSLLEAKAPVQGVALGSHFGEQLLPPERVWQTLDRFAELGLPLSVTDHEIDTWDDEAQADYTRDFLTAVFAHPATVACSVSALWAQGHSAPNAAFYGPAWEERPNLKAWQGLVHGKWSSSSTVSTNGKGIAKFKAFLGYYAIEVRAGAKPKVVYAKLGKSGRYLTIQLPPPNAK
jgi:hypothetical protein